MGTHAYNVDYISLQDYLDENGDEKVIKIHPLVIAKFRTLADILGQLDPEFVQKKMKEAEEANEEYKEKTVLDIYLEAVAFCMETFEPELSKVEKLADHATLPDLEHVLDVVAGVRVNDPNLQAAMAAQSGKG